MISWLLAGARAAVESRPRVRRRHRRGAPRLWVRFVHWMSTTDDPAARWIALAIALTATTLLIGMFVLGAIGIGRGIQWSGRL